MVILRLKLLSRLIKITLSTLKSRYIMSYDGESATLKFVGVTAADEGEYCCLARNEIGEDKTKVC